MVQKSRRPHHSPEKTPVEIERRLIELPQQQPHSAARKLQVVLRREQIDLPVITVHPILLRRALVRAQDQHPTAVRRSERGATTNSGRWISKARSRGRRRWDRCRCCTITAATRWRCRAPRPASRPVKQGLIEAFERCGVPEEMLMDHATPWWNMQAVARWTWLTVWLISKGSGCIAADIGIHRRRGKWSDFTGPWLRQRSEEHSRVESVGRRGWMSFSRRTTTFGRTRRWR